MMKNSMMMTAAGVMAALLMSASVAGASTQTFSSCVGTTTTGANFNIADNVTNTSACTISSENQDFLNPPQGPTVNKPPGFFGFTDWVYNSDVPNGSGQSGTWNIGSGFNLALQQVMLVFKAGQGTTLVGYLVSATSGNWDSPFEEPPFNIPGASPQDVSNISIYSRRGEVPPMTPIPLPAAGWLLLAGVGGLVAMRRKKKAA